MMTVIAGLASLVSAVTFSVVFCRVLKPKGWVAGTIFFFLVLTAYIILIGFFLSGLNVLGSVFSWALLSIGGLFLLGVMVFLKKEFRRAVFAPLEFPRIPPLLRRYFASLPPVKRVILGLMLGTTLLVSFFNLVGIYLIAPGTYDAMTYHLARIAYYLQHNNLRVYDAVEGGQVIRAYNSTILKLYTFVLTGNNENVSQLVQFIAYWVAIFAVYGISREIGLKESASLFSALVFSLLTECLLQCTSTRDDLLITAYLGCFCYLLFAYRSSGQKKFLIMAGLSLGLGGGVKGTIFLVFPSLLVIALFVFFSRGGERISRAIHLKNAAIFLLFSLIALLIFALPSGYWQNYKFLGHPLGGPGWVRTSDSFEGQSLGYIWINGSKHLLRYILKILSFDGLPPVPVVVKAQSIVQYIPKTLIQNLGLVVEGPSLPGDPYKYYERPFTHEDTSAWGVLGFALIWPAGLLVLGGVLKSREGRILILATILFLLLLVYSGGYAYAGGGGRWSIYAAVLASPLAGFVFVVKNKLVRIYLLVITALACFSGFISTFFRYDYFERYTDRYSLLFQDRLDQLTVDGDRWQENCRKFEEVVPAEAKVAICINPNSYEYPLFGYRLTRTIIPINSFWRGLRPVPEEAEYLLFADDEEFREVFKVAESDIHLGWDWYLRKLK